MADSAEKKEPEVSEVGDSEFELMFGKASEEDADLTDLSKDEKTPEELEAEKKEAEAAEADEKTPEELEAEKVAKEAAEADEKTPEELEAEKKAAEEAEAAQKERDTKAEEKRVADEAAAKEAKDEADKQAKEQAEDREKRATLAEDEKAVEAEMAKDFPDVKKVMDIQQRISDAKWEQRFVDFREGLIKDLTPTVQTVNAVAGDAFERAVYGKHPDTQELLPEVEAWVDKQPAFLKSAYNNVLDAGTAAETIELLDAFKGATGRNEEDTSEADAKAAAEKKKADEERERKLESQEGIRGRQDAKTDTAPSTFEDAFNTEASKAM
jgi:hypothetical protein